MLFMKKWAHPSATLNSRHHEREIKNEFVKKPDFRLSIPIIFMSGLVFGFFPSASSLLITGCGTYKGEHLTKIFFFYLQQEKMISQSGSSIKNPGGLIE